MDKDAPYRDGLSSLCDGADTVSTFQASIPFADDTDYLVWQAEQTLRQLQDRIVIAGDKALLARLVAQLTAESVQ